MVCSQNQAWSASAGMGGSRSAVSNAELQQLKEKLQQQNSGAIPLNFVPTAPGHDPSASNPKGRMPRQSPRNPQTERFLEMLGLPYNLDQQSRQFVPPSESLLCAEYLGALGNSENASRTCVYGHTAQHNIFGLCCCELSGSHLCCLSNISKCKARSFHLCHLP